MEGVAENFVTTTSTDAGGLPRWIEPTVRGPLSALWRDRTGCDGCGDLRELDECRDFDDRVMSRVSNAPRHFRGHPNLPIATFFGRDSPVENALEGVSENRFTAKPTKANGLPWRGAAMVGSPWLSLHWTGCDSCGDLRDRNECRDFDDKVMSRGSNPPPTIFKAIRICRLRPSLGGTVPRQMRWKVFLKIGLRRNQPTRKGCPGGVLSWSAAGGGRCTGTAVIVAANCANEMIAAILT